MGDTITERAARCAEPLPGFQPAKPMVFAGIFPTDSAQYEDLRDALDKLRLNDASFSREPESSAALGSAFAAGSWACCTWRSSRSGWSASTTSTSSPPRRRCASASCAATASVFELDNPAKFPSEGELERSRSRSSPPPSTPRPSTWGALLKLCEEKRGTQTGLTYAGEKRVIIRYDLPLTEVVFGFYDRLKSVSRGYASLDYEPKDYRAADLVRLDLLVNGDRVDSLSVDRPPRTAPTRRAATCARR